MENHLNRCNCEMDNSLVQSRDSEDSVISDFGSRKRLELLALVSRNCIPSVQQQPPADIATRYNQTMVLPARGLYKVAVLSHTLCLAKTADIKVVSTRGTNEIIKALFSRESITGVRYFNVLRLTRNTAENSETARRRHFAIIGKFFCLPRRITNSCSDCGPQFTREIETQTKIPMHRFGAYCHVRRSLPFSRNEEDTSTRKAFRSSRRILDTCPSNKHSLREITLMGTPNGYMKGFHRKKELQVYHERTTFCGGEKSRAQLQLSPSNGKLVLLFNQCDQIFSPWILSKTSSTVRTPPAGFGILTTMFCILISGFVCSFGDDGFHSANHPDSYNARGYSSDTSSRNLKQRATIEQAFERLLTSSAAMLALLVLLSVIALPTNADTTFANLRYAIIDGEKGCLRYDESNVFRLTCDLLEWRAGTLSPLVPMRRLMEVQLSLT